MAPQIPRYEAQHTDSEDGKHPLDDGAVDSISEDVVQKLPDLHHQPLSESHPTSDQLAVVVEVLLSLPLGYLRAVYDEGIGQGEG